MNIRLSVCLSVRITSKTTRLNFTKLFCILPVVVARSSPDGVAIRYVLPVLLMTSRFYIMAVWRVMRMRGERTLQA